MKSEVTVDDNDHLWKKRTLNSAISAGDIR